MQNCFTRNFWSETKFSLALLTAVMLVSIAPFWATSIIPATDLPQHLAQTRLLEETLLGAQPDLRVSPWYYPNTMVCWLLYLFWQFADPITVGRLIMSTMAVAWVGSTWLLCRVCQRPVGNWLISTPLVFNFLFAWGLLNFLIGWPLFCIFIAVARQETTRSQAVWLTVVALLLYYAHALWFAMASAWLACFAICLRPQDKLRFSIALIPTTLLALIWYPELKASRQGSGVETGTIWLSMPGERLNYDAITDAMLGSISGPLESIFVGLLAAWLVFIIVTRWGTLEKQTDKPILLAGLALFLAYEALPSTYMNTIYFNARWLPCAMALLLISLPAPRVNRLYVGVLGLGMLTLLSAATLKSWQDWEEEHLRGFLDTLSVLDRNDRVLGLNMMDGSLHLKGRPGLQLFAYAQALEGADIFFSFAEHYSGAIQYRQPKLPNPARYQVWTPGTISKDDVQTYTKVIINSDEVLHNHFMRKLNLERMDNSQEAWRIYRPIRDKDAEELVATPR